MRHLCGLLATEIERWPEVYARPMFGMRAFYRRDAIFALLPQTRTLGTPSEIAYKLPGDGKKWRLFECASARDLDGALACLDKAYRKSGH